MNELFQFPLGTEHPLPCPDCGKKMFLVRDGERLFYKCEIGSCRGNAGADMIGRPLGIPIDREGRRKRVILHNLIDKYWKGQPVTYPGTIRTMIYQFMYIFIPTEDDEFHVAFLNHAQLDKAIEIARTRLPGYMDFHGITPVEEAEGEREEALQHI